MEKWLMENGFTVTSAGSSQSDRRINGHSVEIKLSTEWENGIFKFQQIRDQNYSHIILFGVCPTKLYVWCVPKAVVIQHAQGQHTGGGATETMWLSFPTDNAPAWLSPYGGPPTRGYWF